MLGASVSVLEAGHLAVLWLMLPCLSIIAAAEWSLDHRKNFPVDLVVGETDGSNLAWEQKGDLKALSSLVVFGGSTERP